MLAVETYGRTKVFGTKTAVDHLDLRIPKGSIYGFLGPNGAGKTTTLRMLMGLARPTSGTARILGEPLGSGRYLPRVGFLPDVANFYGWMRAREFLLFIGELFGLEPQINRRRADELLELVGLSDVRTKISGFSRGMKQRLGLAQALVNDPELLLLDEPTSALDPIGRKEVLEPIKRLAARGKTTIIFSTHILADVERVGDTVAVLDRGRRVAAGPIAELRAEYAPRILVVSPTENPAEVAALLAKQPWAKEVRVEGEKIFLHAADLASAQRALPALLVEAGVGLRECRIKEPELEDIFVRLVKRS
ncbi:MAG: ABC transporter ATP-binding protein [Firmicutes bacterium]|nr:ABC transporter ATP-binding protein [Bacillota bacterium]